MQVEGTDSLASASSHQLAQKRKGKNQTMFLT